MRSYIRTLISVPGTVTIAGREVVWGFVITGTFNPRRATGGVTGAEGAVFSALLPAGAGAADNSDANNETGGIFMPPVSDSSLSFLQAVKVTAQKMVRTRRPVFHFAEAADTAGIQNTVIIQQRLRLLFVLQHQQLLQLFLL
jgi:hypothetical protein